MKKTLFILSLCTLFASCSCNDRTAKASTDSSGTCTIDQQADGNNDNQ